MAILSADEKRVLALKARDLRAGNRKFTLSTYREDKKVYHTIHLSEDANGKRPCYSAATYWGESLFGVHLLRSYRHQRRETRIRIHTLGGREQTGWFEVDQQNSSQETGEIWVWATISLRDIPERSPSEPRFVQEASVSIRLHVLKPGEEGFVFTFHRIKRGTHGGRTMHLLLGGLFRRFTRKYPTGNGRETWICSKDVENDVQLDPRGQLTCGGLLAALMCLVKPNDPNMEETILFREFIEDDWWKPGPDGCVTDENCGRGTSGPLR